MFGYDQNRISLTVVEGNANKVSIVLTRDEAQELFNRAFGSHQEDSPSSQTALRKLAEALLAKE